METKFLSDGRKVVVCGKINKTEYIVQEVFITESGDETPSGENFTTKNLHDKPVETYLSRKVANLELSVSKLEATKVELTSENLRLEGQRIAAAELIKRTNYLEKALPEFDWEYFSNVMAGNIKYVLDFSYNLKVSKFEDGAYAWESRYDGGRFEGIRSLTLSTKGWGRDKTYKLGSYADLSGGDKETEFFVDKESLCVRLTEYMNKQLEDEKLSEEEAKELGKYITVPSDVLDMLKCKRLLDIDQMYENSVKVAAEARTKKLKAMEV